MSEVAEDVRMTELYPYQRVGAAHLAGRKAALLADDMGLGKSAQAIRACDEVGARTVLVICPASVRENWKREFKKFSATGIVPCVHSYDSVVRGILGPDGRDALGWDVLILDEAHYLKSKDAKRTKMILGDGGLLADAKHVFLLTGTPMPNHPAELWPMLRACAPETITGASGKPWSYWQFVNKYCATRDNGFGLQIVKGKNLDQLKEKLSGFMLRRLKEEVLPDLPEIRFDELFVEGTWDFFKELNNGGYLVEKTLAEKGVDGLREIAPHVATLRRLTGLAKVKPVVEWVKEWLDAGGAKIVLFAHHREVIAGLLQSFTDKGVRTVALDGRSCADERQRVIDLFQRPDSGIKVFIGQIQAAGTGITLTAASDVLFVESSWVPAENSQAAMRVHRIGQKNACLIRFATLAGSIDEKIQQAVARKTADIVKLLG
jgi:SWI/SNF-related matrix-associated actin-dependent regulator 1 of chromatin subfamily A